MPEGTAELLGGSVLALLMLREVLAFVGKLMARRREDLSPVVGELRELRGSVGSLVEDGNRILLELKVTQDRLAHFTGTEWPSIKTRVGAHGRRLGALESNMAVVQDRLEIPTGMTPPHGIRLPTE